MTSALPFQLRSAGDGVRLALGDLEAIGNLRVDLELEVPAAADEAALPAAQALERYQRRRTRLGTLEVRVDQAALDRHVAARAAALAAAGFTDVRARIGEGEVSVTARVTDGLTSADVSFLVVAVARGGVVRVLATAARVHGHLPTPGPVLAHRILELGLGAPAAPAVDPIAGRGEPTAPAAGRDGMRTAGLCEVELDAVTAILWRLLPAAGWRLPAVTGVAVDGLRAGKGSLVVSYGPAPRDELATTGPARQLAIAHEAMRSVDELVRRGQLDEAMRGYRALLAAGGPDQPVLLERILAVAAARPTLFGDGLELARQAMARWPGFPAALAALASIALARGETAEAAARLAALSDGAARAHDGGGAALAALTAARLLRVIDPAATTPLYQRVLAYWPDHAEAGESLAERLAEDGRFADLAAFLERRAGATADPRRAARDWARAAVLRAEILGERGPAAAAAARAVALVADAESLAAQARVAAAAGELDVARAGWEAVALAAAAAGDAARAVDAHAERAAVLDRAGDPAAARAAWDEALALAPGAPRLLRGAAAAAARAGDPGAAIERYTHFLAVAEDADGAVHLALGEAHRERGERAAALAAYERAASAGGAIGADALAALARLRQGEDRPAAAAAFDRAIDLLLGDAPPAGVGPARAAELSLARAELLDGDARAAELRRAHRLAEPTAPLLARRAAHGLLALARAPADARTWIDAILATEPALDERAGLLVRRGELRLQAEPPELAAAADDADLAAALAPSAELAREARRLRARVAERTGDVGERARALSSLADAAAPADAAADHVEAARAWLAAEQAGAAGAAAHALRHGRAAVAALPADAPTEAVAHARAALGEAAWRQRSFADVREAYAALLAGEPAHVDVPTAQLRLAVALEKNGELDHAIELFAAAAPALVGDPKGQAYRRLAELHEKKGEPEAAATALEAYAAAEDIGTSTAARADAFYRAGELFRRRVGQGEAAVRCLEAALVLVPDHLPALDALELLARDLGDLDRVATILGRKIAASARQPSRQKALLCRLAALQEQLLRPDVARVTLLRALELDPDYRPALRALADLARGRGDRDELADVLARLAAPGPDDGDSGRERITAAIELATLVATDPELGPWRERALALCEALAEGAGAGHGALAEAAARLRAEVPAEPTVSGAARAEAEVARAAGDLARARAVLEEAAAGNDPRVWRELADVCAEQEDWAGCARALAALAHALADTERPLFGHRRAEILLELADIYYDRVGDVGLARAAMRAAADAHGPSARRDSTLRILAAEAASNDDHTEAAAALAEIASERRTAADVLSLAVAWQRAGFDQRAIASLEEVQRAGRLSDEAAMLLFALYQERRRKLDLAQALERNALGVPAPEARARLTDALGLYRDALGDAVAAARIEAALASLPPGDPAPPPPPPPGPERRRGARPTEIERMAEVAAASGDLKGAADLYADAIAARVRAGGDPGALPEAIEKVRAAARAAGHADALVRALFAVAARAPGPLAVELYREAAVTARADLDDEAVVIDALGRAQQLAPGDGELVLALTDALEAAGDFARLADVYERAARAAAGVDRARWLLALSLLCRDRLGDLRRARAHLDAAHAAAPELAAVWLPLADARMADDDVAGARELYERAADAATLDASARSWAAERLAALDRDPDVVAGEVREATARIVLAGGRAPDGGEAAGAAGAVEAPKKDTLRGVTALVRVPALEPGDDDGGDDDGGRRGLLEPTEHDRELRLGAELAQAGQVEAAIGRYEAATSLAPPGDLRALTALELLYAQEGDGEAVSDAIGRQITATVEPRLRARLWRRRAQLYRDVLHREAETYRCLKEAHACDPDDSDIAYELRAVAMARGEWSLTAELLLREIAAASTPRDQGALHLELAMVFDEKLLDPEKARHHYEQALALDPGIPAAPRPLARIYELAGRYRDAAALLEQAAGLAAAADQPALFARAAADAARAGDRHRAVELATRAAVAADASGNREAAARARAEAVRLAAEPARDEARAREAAEREGELARALGSADGAAMETAARNLLAVSPTHAQAFRLLLDRASARGDWATAVELYASRAAAEPDPTEQAGLWFELGRLHAERRADPRAARTAWERALAADPSYAPALDSLAELTHAAGDAAAAAELYARLPPNASRLPGDVLMARRAELAEALGDDARALTLAQQASRLNPSRRDIYATCARLASKLGDLDAAIKASRAALELVVPGDVAATIAARAELAELCRRAGDTIGAVYYFEQVVAEEPHHGRALEALAELYVERGNWGGAVRALRTLAGLAAASEAKATLLHRLGELLLTQLGDVAGADDAFLRASDLDPTHVPTLRRLIDVYWRAGDVGALLEVAQELARSGRLLEAATARPTLARTAVAAARSAAMNLAERVVAYLDFEAAGRLAAVLTELVGRGGEPSLDDAAASLLELARRGGGLAAAELVASARALPGKAGAEVAQALAEADA